MKKLLAFLLISASAFGATENLTVDSLDGKVKNTQQGVGTVNKPYDFGNVTVIGLPGGGGGGGTPGGSNQQSQYNNSGIFGGVPYTLYNGSATVQRVGARYLLTDPTDITKTARIDLSGVTGLATFKITQDSVGVAPLTAAANFFVRGIDVNGNILSAQPSFANISGTFTLAQSPNITATRIIGRTSASDGPFQEITLGTNLTMSGTTLNATGGGGTPGGSTTQLQYNNAGVFGGDASFTSDGTSSFLRSSSTFIQDAVDATKQVNFSLTNMPPSTLNSVVVPAGANPVIVNGVASATANQWVTHITPLGVQTMAQPAFSNISGTLTLSQQSIPIGASRYVDDTNGSDGTGSTNLARPYKTIAAALAACSSGDVVYVGAGTFAQAGTPLVIPAGVILVGTGADNTLITSTVAKATNRRSVEPSTGSSLINVSVQNTNAAGAAFGNGSSSTAFTSAYVSGCKFISNSDGILIGKTGSTGLVMEDSVISSQSTGIASSVGSHTYRGCSIIVDGTVTTAAKGMDLSGGVTVIYRDGSITAGNATTSNICADTTASGTTLELHNVSILRTGTASTANLDLKQAASSVVGVDAVTRPDAAALVTSGTITQLSRYASRDAGLTDYTNLAGATRGDLIYYNGTSYVRLGAGIDGNVLTTHGTTADPTWDTSGGGGSVSDAAFSAAWLGQTTTAPSQNAAYNYLHLFDTDDDGKVNVLDQVAGITNTNSSGVIQTPLTAPSGAIVGDTDVQTLTNKRITKRLLTQAVPGATQDVATDSYDKAHLTGLNAPITISTSGTPQPPDTLVIDLTDDGTARALTWDLSDFEASPGQELPTTTTASQRLDVGFVRNSATGRWRCVASSNASSGVGLGTVTSVGLTGTNGITVTGTSPITSSGTFALSLPITLAGTAGKTLTVSNSLTLAGTDGSTLNVGTGGTLGSNAFTSTAFLTSANISDAVWGSAWNGVTTIANSKNSIYDWGHTFDTDDDGLPDKVDVTGPGLLSVDSGNILALATPGTDYADLAFRTIAVSGQSNVVADSAADTLTLAAGTNITLTTTPGTDTVTIAAAGGGGSGTVTSLTATSPIVVTPSPITTTGVISFDPAVDVAYTAAQTITLDNASSGSPTTALILSHNTSGTPATGIGSALSFKAETSTTANSDAAKISGYWVDPTNASREAAIDFYVYSVALGGIDPRMTLYATGGLSVGSVAGVDPGAGYVNAATGFKINNVALAATDVGAQPLDSDLTTWATKTAPSGTVIGTTDTQTLTNKRVNPRASGGCDETSSATSTPDSDACDQWSITALAAADAFVAPTGTPVNGQNLTIRIKDNGTARALSFATGSSGQYRFSSDMAAPTTTVLSKTMYLLFKWNAADSRWDNLAQMNNF